MKKDTSAKISIEFTLDEIRWLDSECSTGGHMSMREDEYWKKVGQKAIKRLKRALYPMHVPPVEGE